jgi:7-carboxy-7-deazaguanine synthase
MSMEREMGVTGEKRYPVAEIFDSVQGEGLWTGTAMTFVRLAGCHIGGKAAVCRLPDGRSFACDTDYRSREVLSASAISARARHRHVCITGGEPLDHDLRPLLAVLSAGDHHVHLETSGSIDAPDGIDWITVSPKEGCRDSMLVRAQQIKLLVDGDLSTEHWRQKLEAVGSKALVFIQPINGPQELDRQNMARAFAITQQIPAWRLSVQLHKVLRVR